MAGMSWRWFTGHVAGLWPDAAWIRWRRHKAKTQVLEGDALERYWSSH